MQKIPLRTEFGLQISSSYEGLWERKCLACSRAEAGNGRIEKVKKTLHKMRLLCEESVKTDRNLMR